MNIESFNMIKDKFVKGQIKDLTGHKKRVYTIDWSINGINLLSGSVDSTIRSWDITSGSFNELKSHTESVTNIRCHTLNKDILLSSSSDKQLKLWDLRSNKPIYSERTKNGIKNIEFNSDSTQIAYTSKDSETISILDINKFQLFKQIEFKKKINEFEFDKTNNILLVTTDFGSLNTINAKNYDESSIRVYDGHYLPISSINVSKSNKIFATGGVDSLIVLWDMAELMSYHVMKKGDNSIRKIAFSNDDKYLSVIYEGPNIDFFSLETGSSVYTIYNDNQQYSLCWNPNKQIFAYCGDDKNRNNNDEGNIHLFIL